MSNFTRSPLLSLKSPVINQQRNSHYTEVDISEYYDESVGEADFLPSVPASPLKALFSTTATSNNVAPIPRNHFGKSAVPRSLSANRDSVFIPGPKLERPPRPPRIPRPDSRGSVNSGNADAPRVAISAAPTVRTRPVSLEVPPASLTLPSPIPSAIKPELEKALKKPTYMGKTSPPPRLPSSDETFDRKQASAIVKKHRRTRNARRFVMVFTIVVAMLLGVAAGIVAVAINRKSTSAAQSKSVVTPSAGKVNVGSAGLWRRGLFDGDLFNGDGTFYDVSVGTGACGLLNKDTDLVCALNFDDFVALSGGSVPSNVNNALACTQCVKVSAGGSSIVARVVDKCPGCKSGDLDLSREAFGKIAAFELGRVNITWSIVSCP